MFILPLIALTWALLHFKYGQETGMLLFIWPPATLMNIASLAISVVVAVFAVKLRTSDIVFNGLAGVTLAYWVLHTYLMFFGGIRESLMSAFGYVAVCVIAGIWLAVRTAQARRQLGGVKDVQ
jgi:succinate-acetate transporter protein